MKKTIEATHTPTPWKVTQAGENIYLYVDVPSEHWPTHNVIANVEDDMGNAQANAAFIVKAVNSHKELLDTLKLIRTMAHKSIADNPGLKTLMPEVCIRADQAIAQAEEK